MPILDFLMSDDQLKKYWPAAPAIDFSAWFAAWQKKNAKTT